MPGFLAANDPEKSYEILGDLPAADVVTESTSQPLLGKRNNGVIVSAQTWAVKC